MHTIEWAAGLFEGEGCISYKRNKNGRTYPKLYIKMTDRDVIEKFIEVVGYGSYSIVPPQQSHHKESYAWETSKATEVRRIAAAMLPYLGLRRAYKALNILDDLELTKDTLFI